MKVINIKTLDNIETLRIYTKKFYIEITKKDTTCFDIEIYKIINEFNHVFYNRKHFNTKKQVVEYVNGLE